jgi:hypothetical protein
MKHKARPIRIILLWGLLLGFCAADGARAGETSSWVGAFSRMGFGTRGMAMGNAGNAVIHGTLGSYYNPASVAFTSAPTLEASMGMLSLDRSLNFLHFTTRIPPGAGVSVSVINSGVSNIDGRNRDGRHTTMLSTSENIFSFAFGLRFSERLAGGLAFKLLYFDLYEDMSSTTIGIDFGLVYQANRNLTLGVNVKDVNSKYEWDSTPLYGQQGRRTTDTFPILYQFGGAYLTNDRTLLVSVQSEYSKEFDFIFRAGVEAYLTENIILRGGIDNLFESEISKPSLGIGIRYPVNGWTPSFNYALVFEPFAPSSLHIISVGIEF